MRQTAFWLAMTTALIFALWFSGVTAGNVDRFDIFAHCEQFVSPGGLGSYICDTPLTLPQRAQDWSEIAWRFGIARCSFVDPVQEFGSETAEQIQGRSVWICDESGLL